MGKDIFLSTNYSYYRLDLFLFLVIPVKLSGLTEFEPWQRFSDTNSVQVVLSRRKRALTEKKKR
jgi:hypothetical protein